MDGELRLSFGFREGRTCLLDQFQRAPLQVQVPVYPLASHPAMAWVYVVSITGGVVQGDRLVTEISATHGSQLHVTTPAATKIYRSTGQTATHRLRVCALPGAYIEYIPATVIPFRDARFVEEVTLESHPGATLLLGGTMAAGRVAMGERHAYSLYSSRVVAVAPDGSPAFIDHTYLAPGEMDPRELGLLGPYNVLGGMHILTDVTKTRLLTSTLQHLLDQYPKVTGGATELPGGRGCTIRLLGHRSEEVTAVIQAACAAVRSIILGTPQTGEQGIYSPEGHVAPKDDRVNALSTYADRSGSPTLFQQRLLALLR